MLRCTASTGSPAAQCQHAGSLMREQFGRCERRHGGRGRDSLEKQRAGPRRIFGEIIGAAHGDCATTTANLTSPPTHHHHRHHRGHRHRRLPQPQQRSLFLHSITLHSKADIALHCACTPRNQAKRLFAGMVHPRCSLAFDGKGALSNRISALVRRLLPAKGSFFVLVSDSARCSLGD